jgi:hypothetical protein
MARPFHTLLGLFLLVVYVYGVTHLEKVLPGLAVAVDSLGVSHAPKLSRGLLVLYGLPLAAIACFIFPEQLKWWLSPRPPPEFDYLLNEPFWYLLGYVLVALSVGLLLLFRGA